MSSIRCAVVGCGHIGRRHIEVIRAHPDLELAAIVEPERDRAAGHGVPVYAGLGDLLSSENRPDLVAIASPNGLHAAQAIQSLEAGCHTLIEKPMAIRSADARAVIDAAERAKRQVRVVMQNRFTPAAQWLKKLVDSGRLGRLFLVQVNCFWNRDARYYTPGSWHGDPELDGGTLFTQFSHFIDMLIWLFGDLNPAQARLDNFNHPYLGGFEDTGTLQFAFARGGMGSMSFTTAAWEKNIESSITIIAENGSLRLGGQYMDEIQAPEIKEYKHGDLEEEMESIRCENGPTGHRAVYTQLIGQIKNGGFDPQHTHEALRVVSFIEKIYSGV